MDSFQDLLVKYSLPYAHTTYERNVINFFICSAFEDFEIERKILNNRVFPKLRELCFDQFGIEIKIIDIKLGLDSTQDITDTYNHIFNEYLTKHGICDKYNCPIFLLGQKYGDFLIPSRLPMKVYELFQSTMKKYKKRFSLDHTFLDLYYKLDLNSIEPEMMFVNIQEIFPELLSNDKITIFQCHSNWKIIKQTLTEVFQKLSHICLSNGSLDISDARAIFVNELDSSISTILRRSLNSEFQPIIFYREIIDIKNFIEISNNENNDNRKKIISKMIDVVNNDNNKLIINEDYQGLLQQCRNSCYEIYDNSDPIFKILWRDDTGICESHHKLYIEQVVNYFTDKIFEAVNQRSVVINLELSPSLLRCYDIICDANLQTNKYSKLASGYEDICSALLEYVTDDSENLPLILYGPANSGKSIILARTIVELQNQDQNSLDYHIITRYINSNYTINEVLLSIFLQLSAIVLKDNQFKSILKNHKEIENNIPKDIEGIILSFQQHINSKFVIVLHDFEKCLDNNFQSNFTDFIPKILPDNMKLIVTSTETWDSKKPYFLNILVPEFTQTEFNIFVQTQLNNFGKSLTEDQNENLLPNYLRFTNDILTANVLVGYINNFKLNTRMNENQNNMSKDIGEFYVVLLKEWFDRFGEKLITHILLFIYCSQGGLTDQEIIEVLNIDEEIMRELYIQHNSAIIIDEDVLRFPLAFWLFIKQDLSTIIIDKMKDGYLVVDLATILVVESLINSQTEDGLQYFHKKLAEYYIGSWCNDKKSFMLDSNNSDNSFYCYSRDQKMFSKYERNIFYNYRKFRQLVRHLSAAGMHEELLKDVIFNFDWLYNKIRALKVSELLEDFQLSRNGGKEIILLEESFRNSALIIENDLDSLAGELIVQLLPYVPYYPNLRFLIENCDDIAPKHNAFIPIYPTNKVPGSPLVSTINCPGAIESVMLTSNSESNNNELLIKLKHDSRAYFYDLTFGEIVCNTLLSNGQVYLGPNTDIMLVLETEYKQIIKVHKKDTGDLIGQIIPMNWVVLRPFEERNKYKITDIDVAKTKVALIITNEVSYLFVLSLETLEPLLAFNPGVRLQMLKLTPDESTVFTHHVERLVSLDIDKNQLNSAVELQGIPFQMLFTNETMKKAFIVCDNQKSVVVLDLESSGIVNKCYKISFENCLDENDNVLEVSCSEMGNPFLLIRSCHSVILYDWTREKVLSHITRPSQLPIYFKLPNQKNNQPASLQFNAAKLILSDRVIVCALFRDIIVCTVADNQVLKTLHAPVGGIVTEIHIVDQYIIGKVEQNLDSSEVMIWKTEPSCLFSKIETNQDKLTKSVNKLHVGESVSIATCENSDEMGVIEISTGTLIDLYSHSSPVLNSCLSSCGKWAFVTIDNIHNANILWSLEARKIVFEFGSSKNTVYLVQMKSLSGFLCITDHTTSIDSPNFIVTQIICDSNEENSHSMTVLEIDNLKFICEKPCILNDDKVLIFLTYEYYYTNDEVKYRKLLTIWTRENNSDQNGISDIVRVDQLSQQINRSIETIVTIKTLLSKNDVILILYKLENNDVDIVIFNYKTKTIIQFLELFNILPKDLDTKDLFLSNIGNYIYHKNTCSVVDLNTGNFVGNISIDINVNYTFQCFALRDTILVLSQKTKLMAWRLPEICKIGQIELKEEITCVSKCIDDFTLMIGCVDGSILSYSLIDIFSPYGYLSKIKVVRNFQPQSRSPTIQLEPPNVIQKTKLSQEFDNLINIKRPISEPIVAHERREFSNIF